MRTLCVVLLLGATVTAALATSVPVKLPPGYTDEPDCTVTSEEDQWRKNCNWCSCREGRAACTRKLCIEGVQDPEPQCRGHPTWKKDCNTCRCANGNAICTTKFCGPIRRPDRNGTRIEVNPGGGSAHDCVEGSRWRVECNWCTCEGGKSQCTEAACVDWNEAKAAEEGLLECHGSSQWRKDCNWCQCINGKGACTKRACPQVDVDPFDGLPVGATCVPGSRWKEECNWCTCGETGIGICTAMGCLPGYRDDGPTCEEGAVWRTDDCNLCRCEGGASACTKRLCREQDEADPFHGLPAGATCVPGSRFKYECNWCTCGDTGTAGCTLKGCLPGYEDDGPTCEEGAVWRTDDCNLCRCEGGASACTKRLCREEDTTDPFRGLPAGATCVPGSRFKNECNWCTCGDTGTARCTLRGCLPGYEGDGPTCEEGAVWRNDDCNVCRCEGGASACTKRLCRDKDAADPFRGLAIGASCVPGSRFKKGCNWCTCGNTGTAGCTKRGCLPGYRDDGPTCEEGAVWRTDDCNLCRCEGGASACTKRLCRPEPPPPPPPAPETPQCQGNPDTDRWRQDCNWCRCIDGKQACTKRLCRHNSQESGLVCEGTPSWMKDCNRCRCHDGLALCTKKICGESEPES